MQSIHNKMETGGDDAVVVAAATEDDESWLYSGGTREIKQEPIEEETPQENVLADEDLRLNIESLKAVDENVSDNVNPMEADDEGAIVIDTELKVSEDKEAGELSGEEDLAANDETQDGDEETDDSDSDDDDVQVTIGDIKATPGYGYGGTPVNLNIKRGGAYPGGPSQSAGMSKSKGIDLDGFGNINGVPAYEFNLDTLEEKPWRKPGADITDYFNYGFNEDTWKMYCEKQRKLRVDVGGTPTTAAKVVVHHQLTKDQPIPTSAVNENSKYAASSALKKAGPPPGRKLAGSIDVIGGTTTTSRRPVVQSPKENVIQVMTGEKPDYARKPFVEGLPPPPPPTPHGGPHIPGFIPPDLSIPPPGMPPPVPGLPPPGLPPPGIPVAPAYMDHFGGFGRPAFPPPPPSSVGPPIDRGPPAFEPSFYNSGQQLYNPFEQADQSWDSRDRPGSSFSQNWTDFTHELSTDRSPARSETHEETPERRHGSREHRERDRDRDRDRERDKDRDRDRDRERDRDRSDRDRDRERSRDHDRERDRDRSDRDYDERRDRDRRPRDHRDRDKDHRSSRRKHREDEESDHRSSRHKRKRSKRDKDDDGAPSDAREGSSAKDMGSSAADEDKKD